MAHVTHFERLQGALSTGEDARIFAVVKTAAQAIDLVTRTQEAAAQVNQWVMRWDAIHPCARLVLAAEMGRLTAQADQLTAPQPRKRTTPREG